MKSYWRPCCVLLLLSLPRFVPAEDAEPRRPANDAELRPWLENMLWYHHFTPAEVEAATGLDRQALEAAVARLGIRPDRKPSRATDAPLLVLPYPGGRHPRVGFLEGAVRPQRDTKVSVFTPWDDSSYVVLDVPEAIWSNLGLTYLAHTHIDTVWSKQGIRLPRLEWQRLQSGDLRVERTLPNGIVFGTRIRPTGSALHMEMWLTNGTNQPLKDLRVQMCAMLKGAQGFAEQTNENKVFRGSYAACKAADADRWIIMAWEPTHRTWGNPPCPCLHSDPKFPDCPPGETRRLRGWFSFYEGKDLDAELSRIEQTGWRTFASLESDDPNPSREDVSMSLRKAVRYFRSKVGVEGGYLWLYRDDLSRREGEGKASATTAWVQPPGTPTVGKAYLAAFRATGDLEYRAAMIETAHALVRGQLRSGGWDYRIEFGPEDRKKYAYRVDPTRPGQRNVTTLDDNTTQAALQFLMEVDDELDFKDPKINGAVKYALDALEFAQYPNGAWAQRFERPPDRTAHPVRRANYPETWSRTYPGADYRGFYTLNDNTLADMIDTFLVAARIYDNKRYLTAALNGGGFLVLAQMPEPQPAWAQQYDADMRPAWARKFEPPAITGGESQGALRTLLKLYRLTGEKRFLEPVPAALKYLEGSRLPDGRLAHFYELKTNRPLYFTRSYELTYDDGDLPTHYGFKVGSSLAAIRREYEDLLRRGPDKVDETKPVGRRTLSRDLQARVQAIVKQLDEQGRWVEQGKLKYHGAEDDTNRVISTRTFAQNVQTLAGYLEATSPAPRPR